MKGFSQKPVRVLGTDLDGTLLNGLGQISIANLAAISKGKSHEITSVVSTARSIRSARKFASAGELGPLAICQNGAAIYDLETDSLIHHSPIDRDISAGIIQEIREQIPGVIFAVEKLDRFIHENGFFTATDPDLPEKPVTDVLVEVDRPITKIICKHPDLAHEELKKVATHAFGDIVTVTSAGKDWIDFQALGASKASGLSRVCQILGYDQTECAAIGDESNDVPMLHWANYSAATANANEEAKQAANWLAPTNEESGVAAFIHHLINKFNS